MTVSAPQLETRLIEHLCRIGYDDLDEATVTCCKRLVMDTLAVAFPGRTAPGCPEVRALVESWQCPQGASVLFTSFKAAPPMAALANSTVMHALDFDDTLDVSALHAFVTVLPASLAAAEAVGGVDGKTLITALALGVDVICRISLGIKRPLSWIRTATCGSFGAAAAAAKILGLDRERLWDALGIVYAQTSGNAQGLIEGRLVKRMQPAFAASAGVTAAFLAARGITGSRAFLTGSYGYYPLYEQGDLDPEPVLADLGRHYAVTDLSIKPYPCCRMTHSAIDAALAVREAAGPAEDIARIEVRASSMGTEMVGKPFKIGKNPQVDAQFSIPYTVACALVRGDVFLEDFEPDAIGQKEVLDLAAKVRVIEDPALAPKDILPARICVYRGEKAPVETRIDAPLGNPLRPMTDDQCRQKFQKCLDYSGYAIDAGGRQELLAAIEALETLADVRSLLAAVTR